MSAAMRMRRIAQALAMAVGAAMLFVVAYDADREIALFAALLALGSWVDRSFVGHLERRG